MSYSLQEIKKFNDKSKKGLVKRSGESNALGILKKSDIARELKPADLNSKLVNYSADVIDEVASYVKENMMDLVFVIDASGSCKGLEYSTMAGYKALIDSERKKGLPTKVTLNLVREFMEKLIFRKDVCEVPELYYNAGGGTALYDTLCDTLTSVRNAQKTDKNMPKHTLVAIMTDGKDEDSKINDLSTTRKMIKECQAMGWEFIFFGALQNAEEIAAQLGINYNGAMGVSHDAQGFYEMFNSSMLAIEEIRKYGKIVGNWKKVSSKRVYQQLENKDVKKLGLKNEK